MMGWPRQPRGRIRRARGIARLLLLQQQRRERRLFEVCSRPATARVSAGRAELLREPAAER